MSYLREPWWRQYRRDQYRPRKRLNNEMVCRRTLVLNAKDYWENCSLAGISQFNSNNISVKEKIFWLVVFCLVVSTLNYCLVYIWSNLNQPLIVTMESSNNDISNIDFPAVAICNVNRISKSMLKAISAALLEEVIESNRTVQKYHHIDYYEWLVGQAGRLINYEYNEDYENNLTQFDFNDFDTNRIILLMEVLSPSCSDMIIQCTFAGHATPCEKLFSVQLTARGYCCVFNSVLRHDGSVDDKTKIKRQSIRGVINGLSVIMDPFKDDYFYPLHPMIGFEVFLFDPTHFLDLNGGRVNYRLVNINEGKLVELFSRTQRATDEVRKYSIKTRKCLFQDEYVDKYEDINSQSACIIKCRVKAMQSLCKCTSFFLPTLDPVKICSLDNMKCLNKYREKFMFLYPQNPETFVGLEQESSDALFCPECFADCEHTDHLTRESNFKMKENDDFPHRVFLGKVIKSVNMTDKCFLAVYQSTQDGILDRLDVVYYWYELLSNVGGFGGILLGFSLITVVELIYFSILRFFIVFHEIYVANN